MSISPRASSSKLSSEITYDHTTEFSNYYPTTHKQNPNGWSPETSPSSSEGSMQSESDRVYRRGQEDEEEDDDDEDENENDDEDERMSTRPTSNSSLSSLNTSTISSSRPQTRMSSSSSTRGLSPLTTTSILSSSSSSSSSSSNIRKTVSFDSIPKSNSPRISLPKSQPLSRALFTKMTEVPHAGLNGSSQSNKKFNKTTKLIVATKPMRNTFELGLTASELARRV